jgi:hypothetical protein
VERVEDALEDLRDNLDDVKEVSDLLSNFSPTNMDSTNTDDGDLVGGQYHGHDDDELERELDLLMAECDREEKEEKEEGSIGHHHIPPPPRTVNVEDIPEAPISKPVAVQSSSSSVAQDEQDDGDEIHA